MRYNVTISGIVDADDFTSQEVVEAIGLYIDRQAPRQYRGLQVTNVTEVREVTLTVPAEDADLVRMVLDLRLTVAEQTMLAEALHQHRFGTATDEAEDDDTEPIDPWNGESPYPPVDMGE